MTQLHTSEPVKHQVRITDNRRFHRVKVALLGRYMLPNRQEYACQTLDMSPGGAAFTAPVRGQMGDKIIVYLEHIGRIEGEIVRHIDNGFACTISATARKRDKIAAQLTWLINREELGLPEDRRHERIAPRDPRTMLRMSDGREFHARLIDISLSGAAISVDAKPPLGTPVMLGATPGKVVRIFQDGVAIEFHMPIAEERFDAHIML
jgi:c-di-GMP-binding flagellar brake protein YcgR